LFEKLKPTTNTPDRVFQILAVVIEQNEIHEKETAEPARIERRKGSNLLSTKIIS
jgi:hypothetical protein